ncbi:hypothetical protein RJ641_021461, partial [Dillenia turbinata]
MVLLVGCLAPFGTGVCGLVDVSKLNSPVRRFRVMPCSSFSVLQRCLRVMPCSSFGLKSTGTHNG